MLLEHVAASWDRILLWGFLATAVMTIVMQGSQGLGLSRLTDLPPTRDKPLILLG